MPKLVITNIFLYLNKRLIIKMMTHNNQILSSKTLCFKKIILFYYFIILFYFIVLVEMELDPCNFFNPLYLVEIFHFMIFSSTCEMKSAAHHNIIILKISK